MSYQELKIIIEPSYKSGAALGTVTIKDCKFVDFKCDNCASLIAEVERLRAVLFVARHALEYAGGNWIGAMSSRPIWGALSAIDAARGES